MREVDETSEIGDIDYRRPRRNSSQETDFGLVDVARTGQIPLVEQRLTDGPARVEAQASDRFDGIPVGPEQVGTKVSDKGVFSGRRHKRDVVNAPAHRRPGCIG